MRLVVSSMDIIGSNHYPVAFGSVAALSNTEDSNF